MDLIVKFVIVMLLVSAVALLSGVTLGVFDDGAPIWIKCMCGVAAVFYVVVTILAIAKWDDGE